MPGSPPSRGSARGGRFAPRALMVLVGVAGGLLAGELLLRAIGFSYKLYPDEITFGYPNPEEMASDFVPDDVLLWVKPDHDEKVARAAEEQPPLALLGCSCTDWGRYDEALAKRVAERREGAVLDYVNLGTAGWSTYQGRELMRDAVAQIRPRVVTIYFGWNDHWMGFGVDDETAAALNRSWLYPLQGLRLVQLVQKLLVGGAGEPGGADELRRVSPRAFRANLVSMVETARGFGAEPVLLTAPTAHRPGHEPPYLARRWVKDLEELVPLHERYVEIVREVAEREDVPLLDLYARFRAFPEKRVQDMFSTDGIHFTVDGEEVVGELLYGFLDEQGLLPRLLPRTQEEPAEAGAE